MKHRNKLLIMQNDKNMKLKLDLYLLEFFQNPRETIKQWKTGKQDIKFPNLVLTS